LIAFTAEAKAQIDDLRAHWLEKNWIEPLRLERALNAALVRIEQRRRAAASLVGILATAFVHMVCCWAW
jgi:hypothetical protein